MNKYAKILKCFFTLNENPSDKQFHMFADALGVDHEELEAVVYKMMGRRISKEADNEVLASFVEVSPAFDEDMMPYTDIAMQDGSVDPEPNQTLQEVLNRDGGTIPFDKSAEKDDGALLPVIAQRLAASEVVNATIDDSRKDDLLVIRNALRGLELPFRIGEPFHLHYKSDDPTEDAENIAMELQRRGHNLRVSPGLFDKPTASAKAPDGLVLQKINNNIRVFFSKD